MIKDYLLFINNWKSRKLGSVLWVAQHILILNIQFLLSNQRRTFTKTKLRNHIILPINRINPSLRNRILSIKDTNNFPRFIMPRNFYRNALSTQRKNRIKKPSNQFSIVSLKKSMKIKKEKRLLILHAHRDKERLSANNHKYRLKIILHQSIELITPSNYRNH